MNGRIRCAALACLAAASLAGAGTAHAQAGYGADESHIERAPPRPRPPEPIARKDYDKAVAQLFAEADGNRDGTVTLAEFNAAIDARKAQAIGARFAAIDTDRDKTISFAEFSAWQRAMGAAALSDRDSGGAGLTELVAEDLRPNPESGRQGQAVAELMLPLNSVVLVAANTDYDAGVSLAELVAYEGRRFEAADLNHDGWLTADEFEPVLSHGADGVRGPGGPPAQGAPSHG